MYSSEKGTASRHALCLKADGFIGATRAMVVRKDTEPHAVRAGLFEDRVQGLGQEGSAIPAARMGDRDALYRRDPLGRIPVAYNRKALGAPSSRAMK